MFESLRSARPAQTIRCARTVIAMVWPPNPCDRPKRSADESITMMTKTRSKKSVAKKSKSRVAEQRKSERTQMICAATLYTELSPDTAHKVFVTNISLGGLAFKTRREYAEGASYHVKLEAGPIDMNVPVRIVWSSKGSDGIYEVGCEFLPD
jgi:hypothetical protein